MIDRLEFIRVMWINPKTDIHYCVGVIIRQYNCMTKQHTYKFKYAYDIDMILNEGFQGIIPFEDFTATYKSNILFPTFRSRLPSKNRKDIKEILDKYHLKCYNGFKLLKASGGKLSIGNLHFV